MLGKSLSALGLKQAVPPVHAGIRLSTHEHDGSEAVAPEDLDAEVHPVAGSTLIIAYADANGECTERLITCRTLEIKNGRASVCAICHLRNAYRRFMVARIEAVFNPTTGERLGDGSFFDRFTPDLSLDSDTSWGLTPSRKATLVGGLNILAFMARCDGEWSDMEDGPITDFVDRLWIAKNWPGEPPMCAIMDHAHTLAPDQETFFNCLAHYAKSESSSRLILAATSALIAADGRITREEFDWSIALKNELEDCRERA